VRAVLRNLASVIGGEAAVRAANFVAVLFIAREYGRATLGAYALSLAVVTVVVMFADNGLQTAAITQLTSATAGRSQILGRLTLAKAILLGVAALILAAIAVCTGQGPLFLAVGFWVTVRAILQSYSQFQMAVLKSVSRARWIGVIQSIHSAILFLGILLTFKQSSSIFVLLAWLTFAQFLELLFGAGVLYQSGVFPQWPERPRVLTTIKMAAPFGIAYGLANLIVRADTIVLAMFAPLADVGAFSAADSILLIVYVSAWLFGSILLPEMVCLSSQPESLKAFANQWSRWVVLITVPCALFVALVAPRGIVLLYGPAFAGSGVLGSVMVLACPLILLNSIYTTLAFATNRRAIFLSVYGTSALATLALDVFLGRAFGATGIAIAIVIREAAMLLGFWLLTAHFAAPTAGLQSELFQEALESNPPR
jgi:O-antigen/teichoic acid export membrane protein